jgi:poly-gamma-glutamate synthesis protein (capsule biosynthesis protein)
MLGGIETSCPQHMVYIGDPVHMAGLKDLGFTHLTLANNHILDQGEARAVETKRHVEAAGMMACSLPNPCRAMVNDRTIDLFAFNLIADHLSPKFYRDQVTESDIQSIRQSDANIKIVSIHWGDEFSEYPSPEQIRLGHKLVENGANVVLGHHPHVLQGIEMYKGAVIAYSLGNFVFDMDWGVRTRTGVILQIDVNPAGACTFRTIYTRQDADYLPRILDTQISPSIPEDSPGKFTRADRAYASYAARRLLIARFRAILRLLMSFKSTSRETWRIVLGKRLRLFQSSYKNC